MSRSKSRSKIAQGAKGAGIAGDGLSAPTPGCPVAAMAIDADQIVLAFRRHETDTGLDEIGGLIYERMEAIEHRAMLMAASSDLGALFQVGLALADIDLIANSADRDGAWATERLKRTLSALHSVARVIEARMTDQPALPGLDYYLSRSCDPHARVAAALAEPEAERIDAIFAAIETHRAARAASNIDDEDAAKSAAEEAAFWALVENAPMTPAGASALISYVHALEAEGYWWPDSTLAGAQSSKPAGAGRHWRINFEKNLAVGLRSRAADVTALHG
jgi:hypothetical protein